MADEQGSRTAFTLGPSIGTYREMDIPAWGIWRGERFAYDRIAMLDRDGLCDLEQLAGNECVVFPGLIYRRAAA